MICPLMDSVAISKSGIHPPGRLTETIGIALNSFGRGKALYTPLFLTSEYWERGNLHAKFLLQALARQVTP